MKILPVGAELFHADGRTDKQKDRNYEANSRFSQILRTLLINKLQQLCTTLCKYLIL